LRNLATPKLRTLYATSLHESSLRNSPIIMSTIASPRDPSLPFRRTHSSQAIATTPTSSARPSIDVARSTASSPTPPHATPNNPKRANRAALREYYKLKQQSTPVLEVTSPPSSETSHEQSEIPPSVLDSPDFNAETYVQNALRESTLPELLRLYAKVLGEMRALDAEKKALVYDNYSKLIAATETIRRMRMDMDPLNPVASTLDPAIGRVYEMARGLKESLGGEGAGNEDRDEKRRRTKEVVRAVLEVPDRLRKLVAQGMGENARREWDVPRRLLLRWKEQGVGGEDVGEVLKEGDEILKAAEDVGGNEKQEEED
jgi:hypothetical protein